MLVMVLMIDGMTYTIPDRLSLPMIVITLVCIALIDAFSIQTLLPTWSFSLLGGFLGMTFYAIQMMIPAIRECWKDTNTHALIDVLLLPLITPCWIALRIVLWEQKADKILPSFGTIDTLPTWVGGGDLRLGILVGLITGTTDFFIALAIGYVGGSLYYLIARFIAKKHIEELPVAPLLIGGLFVLWIVRIMMNVLM
jgi:hypothetical protein